MPRPSQIEEQTKRLMPIVCNVFSEMGYRRTTTAELAERCGVRENVLYRLWPNKKAMFLAAIDDIFQARSLVWHKILTDNTVPEKAIKQIVRYEATHQGDLGFYRIVFTALTEIDDEEIRTALTEMYKEFQQLMSRYLDVARQPANGKDGLSAESAAWGLIGLATVSNIIRELKLLPLRKREKMFSDVAKCLVGGELP